jgi:hypothetical protein
MTSSIRSIGLSHHAAQAIHQAVDQVLDRFTVTALETLEGGESLERELVDAVRRWAARREEGITGMTDYQDPLPSCQSCGEAWRHGCAFCGEVPHGDQRGLVWHVCKGCLKRREGQVDEAPVDIVAACEVGTGPAIELSSIAAKGPLAWRDSEPANPHPMPDDAVACACSLCMKAIGAVETCSVCGSSDSGGRWHHDVKRTVCDGCFNRWPGAGAG